MSVYMSDNVKDSFRKELGVEKSKMSQYEKRARRIRLFQGVVRRRPPQFIVIIYYTGQNYARSFKNY